MNALAILKQRIKATPLAIPYIAAVNTFGKRRHSQSDEAAVLGRIISALGQVPKIFIEFGFSGWEFNCIALAQDRSWQGLLIDGDAYNATIARTIYHRGIEAKQLWITLDTLDHVIRYAAGREVGVLSIDVDGNDYWFAKHLMPLRPAILCVEVNVSMGLRPLTVPYDPAFDRTKKHQSWEYYGASLTAMHHLCRESGYSLVAMSGNGVNAFFVRGDLLTSALRVLDPQEAQRPKIYPNGSIAPTERFWEGIKNMPFVDVSA